MPLVLGFGTPVVAGLLSGRPFRPRAARKPNACASIASVDQPSASAASTHAGCSRSRSIRIIVKLRAPPPATTQLFGGFGNSGTILAIAATVKAVSVAAPSAGAASRRLRMEKSLRSSDFGGGIAKIGLVFVFV